MLSKLAAAASTSGAGWRTGCRLGARSPAYPPSFHPARNDTHTSVCSVAAAAAQWQAHSAEGLVEPQVVPPAQGHHVAEPHVRHLVQQHRRALLPLPRAGGAAVDEGVGPGDAAVVLHRAAHLRHEHLVVAPLRERLGEALAEQGEPGGGEPGQLVGVAGPAPRRASGGMPGRARARPSPAGRGGGARRSAPARTSTGAGGGEGPTAAGALARDDGVAAAAEDGP
jgi:hypothetical protein